MKFLTSFSFSLSLPPSLFPSSSPSLPLSPSFSFPPSHLSLFLSISLSLSLSLPPSLFLSHKPKALFLFVSLLFTVSLRFPFLRTFAPIKYYYNLPVTFILLHHSPFFSPSRQRALACCPRCPVHQHPQASPGKEA